MGRTVEKLSEQNAVAVVNDADLVALAGAARDLNSNDMVGLPLKFNKGVWLIQEDKDNKIKIGEEDRFCVDMLSYREGWIRWANKKPTHKLMGRRVDGFISPTRDRLPEYNKEEWPVGAKGPEDPWQEQQELVLRNITNNELFTWTSASYGGRLAIGDLLDEYVAEARQHPGEMPVVELSSYNRPTADYGNIPTPQLTIVSWETFGPDASPPGDKARLALLRQQLQALQTLALPKPVAAKTRQQGDGMDDEIPF